MTNWIIVISVGIGTYLARVSFIALLGERRFPDALEKALTYVAPAVFAALVLPAVLLPDGTMDAAPDSNPRFLATVAAALVAWRSKSVVAVIVVGMGVLWTLQAVS